jgi:hypothetical protein
VLPCNFVPPLKNPQMAKIKHPAPCLRVRSGPKAPRGGHRRLRIRGHLPEPLANHGSKEYADEKKRQGPVDGKGACLRHKSCDAVY